MINLCAYVLLVMALTGLPLAHWTQLPPLEALIPPTPCRSCRGPRPPRMYLCGNCWGRLSAATRRALNRKDSRAVARLRELHNQLDAGVPLTEIQVTP